MRLAATITLVTVSVIGCDSGGPNLPSQPPPPPTPVDLEITAESMTIEAGATTTVTVTGSRGDGSSVEGTTVTLSADLGSVAPATVTLDSAGEATAAFTAPDSRGTATVTANSDGNTASVAIEITSDAGQVVAMPEALELDHSRESSRCPNPLRPLVTVENLGTEPISFRVVDDLPGWLTVTPFFAPVPGAFEILFTCDVDEGDLDLTRTIRIQGIDPVTLGDVGEEDSVVVTVRVRD
jgi:hypothetical protein